jgi:hypothetical protein
MEHIREASRAISYRAEEAASYIITGSGIDGSGAATLYDREAVEFPSAERTIKEAIPSLSPGLAVAKGQLINPDSLEDMGAIEVGGSIVPFTVIEVKRSARGSER